MSEKTEKLNNKYNEDFLEKKNQLVEKIKNELRTDHFRIGKEYELLLKKLEETCNIMYHFRIQIHEFMQKLKKCKCIKACECIKE